MKKRRTPRPILIQAALSEASEWFPSMPSCVEATTEMMNATRKRQVYSPALNDHALTCPPIHVSIITKPMIGFGLIAIPGACGKRLPSTAPMGFS